MERLRAIRVAAALLMLALVGAGCAARWAYRQGQEARDRGEWDLAVARYTKALDKDPNNIAYKIALETAKVQASRVHYDLAHRAMAANDWPKAAEELEIAAKYDPQNRAAADDLALVRQRIRKQEDEKNDRAEFEARRARAQAAAHVPIPVLSPRTTDKIRMQFKDTNLRSVFETLGKLANVNVLFDEGVPPTKKIDVNLAGVTFQEALDQLTFANRLFYKVLDQNTIIIVPESRQKRLAYDELLLRTFFLQNAEVNETVNLVKTLAKPPGVVGNVGLAAVTVLGTVEQLAMAERIIDQNDKPRGEVMVEVQILEVDRNRLKNWGIDLSNYTVSATLSPGGALSTSTNSVLNIRPQFLSSLNQADWILSLPSSIFVRFLQNDSTTRILAAPRLRAAEGKPTELRIGTEVPIPVTSYTVGLSGGAQGGYLPATSFQYRNVGVNLQLTPRVSAAGDIELQIVAEFSSLGAKQNVGSESNQILVPTFNTRNVKGLLRLRDGETGLIGGMLSSNETTSFAGALGIDNVPVIGKLFGNRSRQHDDIEVLMSITPHIVRGPRITEEDLAPLRVGTSDVPRVEGARPRLFGPETPPATQGTAPAPGTNPPAGTVPALPVVPAPPPAGSPTPPVTTVPGTTTPTTPGTPPPQNQSASPAPLPQASYGGPAGSPPAVGSAGDSPVALTPVAAAAAGPRPATALFSPTEASLRVGQSAGVAVVLVGARDVQSIEMTLVYDPSLVHVTDVSAGSLLTLDGAPVGKEQALEIGRVRVRFTRATGASGSGAVAALTVRGVKPGSAALSVESLTVGRAGGTDQPALPAPARVVVAP